MANLNKIDIPIAVGKKTKLDLSCDHITTGNWLQAQPVYYRHMIKGESIDIRAIATARLAPLVLPTYGRMRMNLRAFFVPYDRVFPQWHSFYYDVIGTNFDGSSLVSGSPYFDSFVLVRFFTDTVVVTPTGNYRLTSQVTGDVFDFSVGTVRYRFTSQGRKFYKIVRSLGYQLIGDAKSDIAFSAIPLLCWAKIYYDWYANSQYLDSEDVLRLQQLLSFNNPQSTLELTGSDLLSLLRLIVSVVYDGDYFTSAFDNPVAPVSGQFSALEISDPTAPGYSVMTNDDGTPIMYANGVSGLGSQFTHDSLKKLTDFVRRNQMAGSRVIDRALARFGMQMDSATANRSIYIGAQSIDVNVGDIMSTADTSAEGQPSNLGDYAGRAFGQGSKDFSFIAEEFGMLVIACSILPSGGYFQGYDRNNRHLDKFDFFQETLDSLGTQAIEKGELFVGNDTSFMSSSAQTVFGFTGRYGEYKRPISWVSGDMACPATYAGADSWHLFRQFSQESFNNDPANVVHSLSFTRGDDGSSYNRIFEYVGDDVDKFYLHFHFDVASFAPCRPLFDTYEFEDEDKRKKVTLDSNGTKLN